MVGGGRWGVGIGVIVAGCNWWWVRNGGNVPSEGFSPNGVGWGRYLHKIVGTKKGGGLG